MTQTNNGNKKRQKTKILVSMERGMAERNEGARNNGTDRNHKYREIPRMSACWRKKGKR